MFSPPLFLKHRSLFFAYFHLVCRNFCLFVLSCSIFFFILLLSCTQVCCQLYICFRSVGVSSSFFLCINRFLVTHEGNNESGGFVLLSCFFSSLVLIYTFPSVSFLKTKTQEKRTPIYLRAYLILMHHYTLL